MKVFPSTIGCVRVMAVVALLAGCSGVGTIDESLNSPISNDDTYATIGYLWAGARTAILNKREPSTDAFNLPVGYQLPCARGGQGLFQGTLAGTKAAGKGSATVAITASLAACQFDEIRVVRTISAPLVTITGTVAILNDTWDATSIRIVSSAVTVNGVACPGGVNVTITGTTLAGQATSTGTACGRTGAVPLP